MTALPLTRRRVTDSSAFGALGARRQARSGDGRRTAAPATQPGLAVARDLPCAGGAATSADASSSAAAARSATSGMRMADGMLTGP